MSAKTTFGRTEFLRALFRPQKGGFVELRAIPVNRGAPIRRLWTRLPSAIDAFAVKYGGKEAGYGVYYGVCKRRTENAGRKEDVLAATALWADIDCLSHGLDVEKTAELVMSLPVDLHPSALIRSGGGLHLYWFLNVPETDLHMVEHGNRILGELVGGDNVYDATRIMRLPDTWNTKRARKARCEIVFCRDHIRYDIRPLIDRARTFDQTLAGGMMQSKAKVYTCALSDKRPPEVRYAHLFDGPGVIQKKLEAMWRDRVREHAPLGYIGIHEAQVVTTARLALRDLNDERVVEKTLQLMSLVPGLDVSRWDWDVEAEKLQKMIRSWREKLAIERAAKKKNKNAGKQNHAVA